MEDFFMSIEDFNNLRGSESDNKTMSYLIPAFGLISEKNTINLGPLSSNELEEYNQQKINSTESPEKTIGIVRELPQKQNELLIDHPFFLFDYSNIYRMPGVYVFDQSIASYTIKIVSTGATSLRVEMRADGIFQEMKILVTDGESQVFGPYKIQDENFWSNTIKGQQLYIQLQIPAREILKHYGRISISRVVHGIDDIEDPNDDEHEAAYENETQAMQLPTTECQLKPYCIPSPTLPDQVIFEQASLAIAKISYVKGMYSYVASGGLLHNSTNRPLFLTANHCIASQSVAASCEALWAYREACDSAAPNSTFIKTLGATLIATSRLTDFTLLQLKSNPPTGSYYFRWSDEDVSRSSETLYRIHHPHGYPQHYQISRIRNLGGCSMPIGNFIYSNPQLGITATGSSGSPCFRATDGHAELMGQLYGACSSSPQTCNHANVDGAFSATYPMIKAYL